jgi:hypothetical protein
MPNRVIFSAVPMGLHFVELPSFPGTVVPGYYLSSLRD